METLEGLELVDPAYNAAYGTRGNCRKRAVRSWLRKYSSDFNGFHNTLLHLKERARRLPVPSP
jgi:hypothetical protein